MSLESRVRRLEEAARRREAEKSGNTASHSIPLESLFYPPEGLPPELAARMDAETRRRHREMFRPPDPNSPDPLEEAIKAAGMPAVPDTPTGGAG
jgi:hypothetical protein